MTTTRLLAIVVTAFAYSAVPAAADDIAATTAYELRMKGKVDEAKEFLELALLETPDNAAAHYELARTQFHMALGNPRQLEQGLVDAQQSLDHAIEHDSSRRDLAEPQVSHQAFLRDLTHSPRTGSSRPASRREGVPVGSSARAKTHEIKW